MQRAFSDSDVKQRSSCPAIAGEGDRALARWRGRRTRRHSFDDGEATSETPPPPCFAWSPSPAVAGAGADERSRSRNTCAPEFAKYRHVESAKLSCATEKEGVVPAVSCPLRSLRQAEIEGSGTPTDAVLLVPCRRARPRIQRDAHVYRRSTAVLT